MSASKRTMYLTKEYFLEREKGVSSNVFLFNENGTKVHAKWVRKNIEKNPDCYIILDHKNAIFDETEHVLIKKNYGIETVNLRDMRGGLSINPFDLLSNTSEIHFMFLNFLYAMWDNTDPDISAMSNLIDAFASFVFFVFGNQKEKLNMETLRKMVYSVRATCQTEEGIIPMSDAIFANLKDQDMMPCKYYAQFKKAAGDRQDEIAEKVAKVFDMLTENDMEMMRKTDDFLYDSFNFKTAIFINVDREEEEHSAKIMATMLNYFVQRNRHTKHVMFVIDKMDAKYSLISLPYWMKEACEYNMSFIAICDNLAEFKTTQRTDKYFRSMQKWLTASVLVHQDDKISKFETTLPTTNEEMEEYTEATPIATVLFHSNGTSEEDELF